MLRTRVEFPTQTNLRLNEPEIIKISEFKNVLETLKAYFVCVYPGCKTVLPKIVTCEGPLIMMTGPLQKKKKKIFNSKKRGGFAY